MTGFVEQEVSEMASNPSDSDEAVLLVGYARNASPVEEAVRANAGEVIERLPYRSLRVSMPEQNVEVLLKHPEVETVELDHGMETLQGN
jgi:hypothetical protein